MAQGGKRPGAGRPKGSRNKRTVEVIEAVKSTGMTPLEYLTSVYQDVSRDEAKRIDAAKAAAPYVHAKLNSVELSGNPDNPIEMVNRIELVDGDGEDSPTA